jgi:hypothetical protein
LLVFIAVQFKILFLFLFVFFFVASGWGGRGRWGRIENYNIYVEAKRRKYALPIFCFLLGCVQIIKGLVE